MKMTMIEYPDQINEQIGYEDDEYALPIVTVPYLPP